MERNLAVRMDADVRALSDTSVASLRQTRRRWSATLQQHAADEVLSLGLEMLERPPPWSRRSH
jgi:hypothetical protein